MIYILIHFLNHICQLVWIFLKIGNHRMNININCTVKVVLVGIYDIDILAFVERI